MIKSLEKLADTTIQFSAPVRANSPELQQLFDFIVLGASERDRDRILPFDVVELIRRSRLGALRIPVAEGGGGSTARELFFYMVSISALVAIALGLPLGLLLVMTVPGNLLDFPQLHKVLGAIVNTGRSFPFIILLVVLTPLTRLIVGTSISNTAALVPLTLAAIPFFGRIAETSILEVDKGLIEAAQAMGCNYWQIVLKVLIPEALPSLVLGMTILR